MDKIFKIGLLVLGFGFLAYLYCPHTNQVGRFRCHLRGNLMSIIDTTNGVTYSLDTKGKDWVTLNPITGKSSRISIKKDK
jgi:hypothetical protein